MWIISDPFTFRLGPFVDETDGFTAETGLAIVAADVRLSKHGGVFAAKNDATDPVHDENGWYVVALDGTDTDTPGSLIVAVHVAGARPVYREIECGVSGALSGVGDIGDTVWDYEINGLSASARLENVVYNVWEELVADHVVAGSMGEALGAAAAGSDPVAVADAVWDEAIADHIDAGSTGESLTIAATGGDPWETELPGAYTSGQAGKIIGDNLNTTITSRASQASVDALQADAEAKNRKETQQRLEAASDAITRRGPSATP